MKNTACSSVTDRAGKQAVWRTRDTVTRVRPRNLVTSKSKQYYLNHDGTVQTGRRGIRVHRSGDRAPQRSPGRFARHPEASPGHIPRKFLCRDVIRYIADRTDTPESRIFSVVTFCALFNREPQGDHNISICRGTACHTRGSRDLLESVRLELHLNGGEAALDADKLTLTTPDGSSPSARSRASDSVRWRRWWNWITASAAI